MTTRKLSNHNPKLIINLIPIFNDAFASKTREQRSAMRQQLSNSEFKAEYGRAYVDKIIERTEDRNVDKDGRRFKRYSKGYKDSLTFRIYGKSSSVNLHLTGAMLSSMNSKNKSGTAIMIEFSGGEGPKAHGHITGGGRNHSLPVRDFFGLPRGVERQLMKELMRFTRRSEIIFDVPTFDQTITEPGTELEVDVDFLTAGGVI